MPSFAPIALFVYNRPDVLQKVLFALQQNPEIKDSVLYVFSDGPKTEEAALRVEMVREMISKINWCREVKLVSSEVNKGLAQSIVNGIGQVLEMSDRLIVLEDDLVVTKGFLKYMNEALDTYATNLDVISISGYMYPVRKKLPETFFINGADCWGWATWKRGWELMEFDAVKLYGQLLSRKLLNRFDFNDGYPFAKMLKDQAEGGNYSWAILWNASAFLAGKLTLYPSLSLVEHIGRYGTNYSPDPFMDKVNLADEIKVNPIPVVESGISRKAIADFFSERKGYNHRTQLGSIRLLLKRIVKNLTPYFIRSLYRQRQLMKGMSGSKREVEYVGNYVSWKEAMSKAEGYETKVILNKVREAALLVKTGKALFERDSVVFHAMEFNWFLLSELMDNASLHKGTLSVLDFGGSLGSAYFQNRKLLSGIEKLEWSVVEQQHFVDCGKQMLQTDELKFYKTIEEVVELHKPNVILLSSVIQYMEDPLSLLEKVLSHKFERIIIERTAFINSSRDRITIQRVPESIYKASYPAWFFNYGKFVRRFDEQYALIESKESEISRPMLVDGVWVSWRDMIFRRK